MYKKSYLIVSYSLSCKTVNTSKNFLNVYCFNQMWDETTKDNRQTAAWICHNLIQNNKLGFSFNQLAFLPQLIFKNQTAKFGIALEVTVNNYCQNQILQHYEFSGEGFSATKKYRSKTTNHSQLACPFELHMKQTPVSLASNWLVSFCSHTRCPALSDHIYSISRRFPHDISLIYHSYLFPFCH